MTDESTVKYVLISTVMNQMYLIMLAGHGGEIVVPHSSGTRGMQNVDVFHGHIRRMRKGCHSVRSGSGR